MPWCPNCKNEYVEGIKKCADCGCELVAALDETKEAVIFGEQEQMGRLLSFLQHNGITTASMQEDEAAQLYEIFVSDKEHQQAKRIANIFLIEEAKKQENTAKENTEETVQAQDSAADDMQKGYLDSARMAAECKESAYALLGVGIVGLAAVLLIAAGVLPVRISYMISAVMAVLFLGFVIIGIRSIGSAKVYRKRALSESHLKEEIMRWCGEYLTAEKVDEMFAQESFTKEELSDEEKYFKRTEYMRYLISQKFINIEGGFLDNLIDELYPGIFET